jgi:hypothetical protein
VEIGHDHVARMTGYVRGHLVPAIRAGDEPRVVRVDRNGFMVRLGDWLARLAFPEPVTGPERPGPPAAAPCTLTAAASLERRSQTFDKHRQRALAKQQIPMICQRRRASRPNFSYSAQSSAKIFGKRLRRQPIPPDTAAAFRASQCNSCRSTFRGAVGSRR